MYHLIRFTPIVLVLVVDLVVSYGVTSLLLSLFN